MIQGTWIRYQPLPLIIFYFTVITLTYGLSVMFFHYRSSAQLSWSKAFSVANIITPIVGLFVAVGMLVVMFSHTLSQI